MAGGHPGKGLEIEFCILLVSICLFFAIVGSYQVVHQPRYVSALTPSECGLEWEPLRLRAADGVGISGWLIRQPAPRGTLLLFHGFGTAKADLLDVAQAFCREGEYALVMIDFRGHGDSEGERISFGKHELLDVKAALDFVAWDPALKGLPIGCYGISMGGAIAIQAAVRYKEIRAVVSDSAYEDLGQAVARGVWQNYHIPRIPLGQMVIWGTEARLGCLMKDLSPIRHVGKIAPRPIFIMHGMSDKTTPHKSAEALYKAAGEPKRLWLVPGAEHVGSFYFDQGEYLRQIFGFFRDAFRGTA